MRQDIPPVLALLLVVLVFYWPTLSGATYLWADFIEQDYPLRQFGLSELAAGRLPVWAPNLFSGVPFLAMIDNGVLYPVNWLLIPFVNDEGLSFLALERHLLAHVALLGVGMYWFCRTIGVSRIGAFTAAGAWMLSGPVVHQVFHAAILQTVTWLPLVLALLFKALERGSLRWAGAAAAAWGMTILGGNPQVFLYSAYAMGLLYLVHVGDSFRAHRDWRAAVKSTGLFCFAAGLGTALAAVALFPAVELAGVSVRSVAGLEGWGVRAADYRQLITFVLPGFFGEMGPVTWDYWGPGQSYYGYFWETYVYLGMLPFLLAGVGLVCTRGRHVVFLGSLAGLSLLGILGALTPFPSVQELVPGFAGFRAHGRLGLILGFAVAALAGVGLDALIRSRSDEAYRSRVRVFLSVATALATLIASSMVIGKEPLVRWLAGSVETLPLAAASLAADGGQAGLVLLFALGVLWLSQQVRVRQGLAILAILAVIWGDLLAAGAAFSRAPISPEEHFPETELVGLLRARAEADGGRVAIESVVPRIVRLNAGLMYGLEIPLDGFASPLRLGAIAPPASREPTLDLLNVTHEVRRIGEGAVAILDRPGSMPRAWVARDFVVASGRPAVADVMAEGFDHRTTVTLDRAPDIAIASNAGSTSEAATVTRPRPDRVTVEVEMVSPGLLVLSEVHYPAWKAWVNGEPHDVLRADGALRAVALEAGSHAVDFRYESATLRLGAATSAIAVLALLSVALGRPVRAPQSARSGDGNDDSAGGGRAG